MFHGRKTILITLILLLGMFPLFSDAQAQSPVVRAVLFYSPACGHCKQVIEEVLPVLDQQYGTQLQIYGVNTYTEAGNALFYSYIDSFEVPPEKQGVPAMVIGDQYLVGSQDIPELFPGLIDQGLSDGGMDWPDIPGLEEYMASGGSDPQTSGQTSESSPLHAANQLTLKEKFTADLAGNSLAVVVLAGMLAALVFSGVSLGKADSPSRSATPAWLIPLLSLIGIGVAGYLSYVEVSQVEAVCGPVGNCNAVQQSPYATLFGILPVGALGLLGYLGIIILWLLDKLELAGLDRLPKMGLWALTLFGILFSIYLTFLEPFVIGASCMWCLSSAVIMTLLFLVATRDLIRREPVPDSES